MTVTRTRAVIFLLAIAMCGVFAATWAKPGSAPKTHGPFDLVFAGGFSGEGKLVIGAKSVVYIKGSVVELATGKPGTFDAGRMDVFDGRFEGTALVMGKPVKVVGRVEPPDGVVIKRARVTCTFCEIVNGQPAPSLAGRIFGSR